MTCATCVTAGDEDELIFIVIVNEAVDDTVFIWSSLLNECVSGSGFQAVSVTTSLNESSKFTSCQKPKRLKLHLVFLIKNNSVSKKHQRTKKPKETHLNTFNPLKK